MAKLKEVHFISTPIGNLKDITFRALELLKDSEVIIVEDYREGKKLLQLLKVDLRGKELIELNEHNEKKESEEILKEIAFKCHTVSLISDGGQPVVADPGFIFMNRLIDYGIRINYLPGPSSIMGALMVSGLPADHFYYCGFLPRREDEREKRLKEIKRISSTLVILETPYRLSPLIKSLKRVFPPQRRAALCFNLTTERESIFRGSLGEAYRRFGNTKGKDKFVLLLDNRKKSSGFFNTGSLP